jgi:hypothetical protein
MSSRQTKELRLQFLLMIQKMLQIVIVALSYLEYYKICFRKRSIVCSKINEPSCNVITPTTSGYHLPATTQNYHDSHPKLPWQPHSVTMVTTIPLDTISLHIKYWIIVDFKFWVSAALHVLHKGLIMAFFEYHRKISHNVAVHHESQTTFLLTEAGGAYVLVTDPPCQIS